MRTCRGTFNGRADPGGEWAFRTGNGQLKKAEFCHLTGTSHRFVIGNLESGKSRCQSKKRMKTSRALVLTTAVAFLAASAALNSNLERPTPGAFDHSYRSLAQVLRRHVVGTRVDYTGLQQQRAALDAVVAEIGRVEGPDFDAWTDDEQIAYWINAYNVFTLQAVVDNYPVDGGWLSFLRFAPRNSVKQISGVWTDLRWPAAGEAMTLDEIEHGTLRVLYDEPRIHFAVNCAAVSCPPLRAEPYVAKRLDRQLVLAARDFLASDHGLQVEDGALEVSSLLDWYGEDFVDEYGHLVDAPGSAKSRAILGLIATYGPSPASRLAQTGDVKIRFLDYDWGLNDATARWPTAPDRPR